MRLRDRLLGIVILLGGSAGVVTWLANGPAAARSEGRALFQASAECRKCHQDVWDEWHGSHHQIAYLNQEVRALSEDFRNKECQACHLPRPVAETGYGNRVLPRQTQPDEGVSCLTCHQAADGTILGRHDRPEVPCAVRASAQMPTVDMCASCHNQHKTTDQWRATVFGQPGVDYRDCNDCHMPVLERKRTDGSVRQGRGHAYHASHDKATIRSAYQFEVRAEGREVTAALTNSGAGHHFPTEERSRAADIMVRFLKADGNATEWQREYRFRMPYRDEPDPDTQLPHGQTKAVKVAAPGDAVAAEVRLWYRLTPFCDDHDPRSTLLEERKVELK